MIKKILDILRRFIVGVLLIYAYNKMALPLNMYMPMNIFTILLVTVCGLPSIIMLILFSLVCV